MLFCHKIMIVHTFESWPICWFTIKPVPSNTVFYYLGRPIFRCEIPCLEALDHWAEVSRQFDIGLTVLEVLKSISPCWERVLTKLNYLAIMEPNLHHFFSSGLLMSPWQPSTSAATSSALTGGGNKKKCHSCIRDKKTSSSQLKKSMAFVATIFRRSEEIAKRIGFPKLRSYLSAEVRVFCFCFILICSNLSDPML